MEDILASIRKILSEDDGEAAKPAPAEAAPPPPPPPPPAPEPEPEPVFEPEPEPVMEFAPDEPVVSIFDDVPEEDPVFMPEAEPDMPLQLTDSMMVEQTEEPLFGDHHHDPAPSFAPQGNYDYGQGLVSNAVAQASGASISQLANAVARERAVQLGNHGLTLEQLVREICTPILKQWLDSNLPYMVERVVKQEIERIASRSERM